MGLGKKRTFRYARMLKIGQMIMAPINNA